MTSRRWSRHATGPSLAHRLRVEAHVVWLTVRDRRTPWPARLLGVLLATYALSPIDLIPDFVPILGLLDDVVILPLGLMAFERMVPAALLVEHRATAEAASRTPISWVGLILVVACWGGLAWFGYATVRWLWD